MNKNPDNINRYLSSLRRFASLKEILQNHEDNILIFAIPGGGRHDSFYLHAKLPPICQFHDQPLQTLP